MTNESIVPFWQRLREISLYPSKTAALTTIAVLAVLRLLGLLPMLGFFVNLAITIALYKYAFEVLRASANGRMEPPEGGLDVDESVGWQAIVLQAAFIVIGVASFLILGIWGGIIVSIVLMLGLPGAVMSFAMDQNLGHALNPATWLQIMARLGWPYFVAFALMLVIQVSAANAQSLLVNVLPLIIGLPVFHFLSAYALIATFHLMGYLIWQYHEELGYVPEEEIRLSRASEDPDQLLLDDVSEMIRDGEIDMATELMTEHVRARGGSDAVHLQYRKLLRLKPDNAALLRHGKEWLPVLLAQDKEKAAIDLFRELAELDPTFVPADAESNTRLAQRAAVLGQAQLALRLINGFHKRHPKSADIPAMYLLAARLLSERMGKDAEARALLNQLKGAFPNHPLIPEVDALLSVIDRVDIRSIAPG